MPLKIKICGITRIEDAQAAVQFGADMLGFNFSKASPRRVNHETAARIIRALPASVARVGVFVDAVEEDVRQAVSACALDTLQFHGNESPDFCAQFSGLRVIKAFRMQSEHSLADLPQYSTQAWLLDSYVPGQSGGTGAVFNWDLAIAAKALGRPIILAGGLTAENVAQAVQRVRPYGVDVASGVESAPGLKDPDKMRRFIEAARQADREAP